MMTDGEPLFVNTNILVYLTNSASSWHADVVQAVGAARSAGAHIVATMRVHGIGRLLTHNVSDFSRYGTLIDVVRLVPAR